MTSKRTDTGATDTGATNSEQTGKKATGKKATGRKATGTEATGTNATGIKAKGWAHSFPVSGGVHAGRRWTRRQLESFPWTADEPETVDAVVLAVSELLTNAHIHAHSDAHLILTWDGDCLHVSVHDEDPTLPRQRSPRAGETSGRGVGIVRMLADTMEMRCQRHGKTVSACFRPARAGRPDAG